MNFKRTILLLTALIICSVSAFAQGPSLLKRTTYKTDRFDFGVGGSLVVTGAPTGSIRIEGWSNREVEISAEIEVQASTEADLKLLSEVTSFALEESLGRIGVVSVGSNDKKYLKKIGRKLPKALLGLPFRIDYVIKVPKYCDLQITGGKGDLSISDVEGVMNLNYLETNATLDLVGGAVKAVFGSGSVIVSVPSASWRGRYADIQLATGTMDVHLPPSLNAEVDATVLRTGKVENDYEQFKPRIRTAKFTDKSVIAKSGVGGISLKFTVGDGTLRITPKIRAQM
ncbi:MAG: hypothetical protein ABI539_04845 [Acidobacteriota bacterium]